MLRSLDHVTPEEHEGFSANPWTDISVNTSSDVTEARENTSTTVEPPGSCYHARSPTNAGDPLRSQNDCQNVLEQPGASDDLFETRPSLKKAISTNRDKLQEEGSFDITARTETTEAEAEVIVQPGDSLPGVALKYNVSLSTLRSANKLWAHDTIHLRQVLYIPIQAVGASKAKPTHSSTRARLEHLSCSLHSTPEVHIGAFPRIHRNSSNWGTNIDSEIAPAHAISTRSTSIIRRIPLSELSFFPPSSTSALSSPSHTPLGTQKGSPPARSIFNGAKIPPSSFPNLSTRGFGLTNFWTGAKDEIISRLSFDSTRGSSDASEEHDLELDVVRPYERLHHALITADDNRDQELIPQPNGSAIPVNSVTERDSVFLNTPGKLNVVRTVQLQPSPKMVIPASN